MLLQGQISLPFSIYIQCYYGVKPVSLFRFTFSVITGSNQSPFFHLQCYYRVKSVSLFRFKGQISLPFSIYNVITGSNQSPFFDLQCYYRLKKNQSPFFDLQCYYRVKSVTLFRFTRFLQGEISLPFSIYNNIKGSNQFPFLDL